MLSGPTAFRGLMLLMRFSMPFLEIEMFFMIGCVLGSLSGISVFASDEKLLGIAYSRYWLFLLDLHARLLHF
jgi:hypothetical protein